MGVDLVNQSFIFHVLIYLFLFFNTGHFFSAKVWTSQSFYKKEKHENVHAFLISV